MLFCVVLIFDIRSRSFKSFYAIFTSNNYNVRVCTFIRVLFGNRDGIFVDKQNQAENNG